MLTRRSLIAVAVFTLACFVITSALPSHGHGFTGIVGDVTWFGFLFGLLFLLVGCVFVLVRSSRRRRAVRS